MTRIIVEIPSELGKEGLNRFINNDFHSGHFEAIAPFRLLYDYARIIRHDEEFTPRDTLLISTNWPL